MQTRKTRTDHDGSDLDGVRGVEPAIASYAPRMAEPDWDLLGGADPAGTVPSQDDIAAEGTEIEGELPEEDDDNPDQESDEALPDDDEERAIRRDMGGEAVRFEPE